MFVIFVFHQRGTLNGNFLHVKLNSTWYNNNYCTIIEKMKFCLFYTFCVLLNLNFPEREKKRNGFFSIGMVCTVKSRPKTSQSACSIQPENCLPYNHGLFPPFPPPHHLAWETHGHFPICPLACTCKVVLTTSLKPICSRFDSQNCCHTIII